MHLVLNASQCDTAGGLYNELHLPHPQLWKNKWNEEGGEGVVGLYRAKKGVQDQVSWTSVPHHHWCQLLQQACVCSHRSDESAAVSHVHTS